MSLSTVARADDGQRPSRRVAVVPRSCHTPSAMLARVDYGSLVLEATEAPGAEPGASLEVKRAPLLARSSSCSLCAPRMLPIRNGCGRPGLTFGRSTGHSTRYRIEWRSSSVAGMQQAYRASSPEPGNGRRTAGSIPKLAPYLGRVRYGRGAEADEVQNGDLPALAAWALVEMIRRDGVSVRRCRNCKQPFLTGPDDKAILCERPAPGRARSCRALDRDVRFQQENADYRREYKRAWRAKSRGQLSKLEWEAWRRDNKPDDYTPYDEWLKAAHQAAKEWKREARPLTRDALLRELTSASKLAARRRADHERALRLRNAAILAARKAGHAPTAIGWACDPPISRQRVEIILAREKRRRRRR